MRPLETGAAVSRRSLPESAQAQVVTALNALLRDGAFKRHFPASSASATRVTTRVWPLQK